MRAIITGAGGDIGRAIALRIGKPQASEKPQLLVTDVDGHALAQTAALLQREGIEAISVVADLRDVAEPRRIVERAASAFGGIDALVSNAGLLGTGLLRELSLAEYELQFEVNTRATFLLGQAAYPLLRDSRGALVATSTISSENPSPGKGTYAVSKAALNMLVRQMAVEWGPDGIRCNCVSPGPTLTRMNAHLYVDPAAKRKRDGFIPMRRMAACEDIADVIAFLVGPDSRYVSGVNIMVDGALNNALMSMLQ